MVVRSIRSVSGRGGKSRKLFYFSPMFAGNFDDFVTLLILAGKRGEGGGVKGLSGFGVDR